MKRLTVLHIGAFVVLIAALVGYRGATIRSASQSSQPSEVPTFEYDPAWPKPLPNNWVTGNIGAMAVDSQDHIWVAQRPSGTTSLGERYGLEGIGDCCFPAPPIMEFESSGKPRAGLGSDPR